MKVTLKMKKEMGPAEFSFSDVFAHTFTECTLLATSPNNDQAHFYLCTEEM